jgi:hypothetical protein
VTIAPAFAFSERYGNGVQHRWCRGGGAGPNPSTGRGIRPFPRATSRADVEWHSFRAIVARTEEWGREAMSDFLRNLRGRRGLRG